jgi:hypothetical protein
MRRARLSDVHPYIMANGEITLAGAALAVALTALFIAVGQLPQQVFWYHRRLSALPVLSTRSLGSQNTFDMAMESVPLRGQIRDTTPCPGDECTLPSQTSDDRPPNNKRLIVAVDRTGSDANPVLSEKQKPENTDLVGWVELLKQLELLQQATWNELGAYLQTKSSRTPDALVLSPAMVLREWSWEYDYTKSLCLNLVHCS